MEEQTTADAIVETVDTETTEAGIDSDITLDEAGESVEPAPTEEAIDPTDPSEPIDPTTPTQDETSSTPEYTEPGSSVEPVQDERNTTVDDDSSFISHLISSPETSTLKSNYSESEIQSEEFSSESCTSIDKTISTVSNLENIVSDNPSQAVTIANDFVYKIVEDNVYIQGHYQDMTFAVIESYVGQNRNVIIPATLGGYPVAILREAFENTQLIDTLTISEGINFTCDKTHYQIGDDNLYLQGSSIRVVNIPSTWEADLSYFGWEKTQLQAINISSDNQNYCSIDGVVYSKDKTKLLFYPGEKLDSTFTTPSTVTTIEQDAFINLRHLETLNISDSVTTVGEEAFRNDDVSNEHYSLQTINLGKSVQIFNGESFQWGLNSIKDDNMPAVLLSQINVDPKNPYFSSENGVLYNKDKSEIVFYPPCKAEYSFKAPDSVNIIQPCAFYVCPYLKEIIFPSKIYYLANYAITRGHGGTEIWHDPYGGSKWYVWPINYIVFLGGISNPANMVSVSNTDSIATADGWEYEVGTRIVGDDSVHQFTESIGMSNCYLSLSDYQSEKNSNTSKPTNPNNPNSSSTWIQDSIGWWYKNADGSYPKNAWAQIGGTWYHFNKSGYMQTGWQQIGGTWYYLKPSGAMATGWTNVGGTWYYLKSSGAMATGWQQIGGAWYYLNGSGAMQTGWYKVGPHWYYSNGSGVMQSNRWIGNYYLGSSGAMATSQWVGNYYVDANGLWVH